MTPPDVPVPCAFKPVENVSASGVVDLVERVSVGLLDRHSIAKREKIHDTAWLDIQIFLQYQWMFCQLLGNAYTIKKQHNIQILFICQLT